MHPGLTAAKFNDRNPKDREKNTWQRNNFSGEQTGKLGNKEIIPVLLGVGIKAFKRMP